MIFKAYPAITLGWKTYGINPVHQTLMFDSLFVLLSDLYDEVSLVEQETGLELVYLNANNQQIHFDSTTDLVLQTIHFLELHHGIKINAKIVIRQNIPVHSGLYTPVAAAAVVLKYYADLHDLPLNFHSLATQLHFALPFLVSGFQVARVNACGDQIVGYTNIIMPKIKLHFQPQRIDLNFLFQKIPTWHSSTPSDYIPGLIEALTANQPGVFMNDLQPLILQNQPNLILAYAKLKTRFNHVLFSGQGSTLIEINDPIFEN